MIYYTYVVKSEKDNSYYIGYTQDIIKRLEYHNKGKSRFTKSRRPYKLVFKKEFETRKKAMNYEMYLKSLKKRSYLEKIIDST
jgi:putative endonuclease